MDEIFDGRRKRLRQFINTLIIKDNKFAKSIGKRPAVVSQLLTGYRNISADFVYEVSKCYTWLNPEWLISGKGEMRLEPEVVESNRIGEGEPQPLEHLELTNKEDPLAGLRDLVARIEELERWKASIEKK
jgi:hypothetical protein